MKRFDPLLLLLVVALAAALWQRPPVEPPASVVQVPLGLALDGVRLGHTQDQLLRLKGCPGFVKPHHPRPGVAEQWWHYQTRDGSLLQYGLDGRGVVGMIGASTRLQVSLPCSRGAEVELRCGQGSGRLMEVLGPPDTCDKPSSTAALETWVYQRLSLTVTLRQGQICSFLVGRGPLR